MQSSPCLLVRKSIHLNAYCIPFLECVHKCLETPDDPQIGAAVRGEGAESRRSSGALCQNIPQKERWREYATGMDNGLQW